MRPKPTLRQVHDFWESQPLFVGESTAPFGSEAFFAEHRHVYIADCFAGSLDQRLFPNRSNARILDAGCGVGMWSAEFAMRGYEDITACDLTNAGVTATRTRLQAVRPDLKVEVLQANIEQLPFQEQSFDHINCQGVLHHTPNPRRAVAEFHRILRPGGTALLSVYHVGLPVLFWSRAGVLASRLPGLGHVGLRGRGREELLREGDVHELVRKYDGAENPLGVAYTRSDFRRLLDPLEVDDFFLHSFPARALPFPIPRLVHRGLDRMLGLLIFARVRKSDGNNCLPASSDSESG